MAGRRRAVALRRAAFTDRLTGLYRYEYFADALPREIERVRRYSSELSLVLFDLDRFKDFNDRYGHAAGNQLLEGVGRALQRETRGADLAARFGGEELIVLVQGSADEACALAERVRRAVGELAVRVPEGLAGTTSRPGWRPSRASRTPRACSRRPMPRCTRRSGGGGIAWWRPRISPLHGWRRPEPRYRSSGAMMLSRGR